MAIFDFLRNKGKKLLGSSRSQGGAQSGSGSKSGSGDPRQQQQFSGNTGQQQFSGASRGSGSSPGSASGSSPGASQQRQGSAASTQQDSNAIREHIMSQDDVSAPDDLVVMFDADDGVVIIEGTVPDEDTAEAIVLIAGDIDGVCAVDDRMSVQGQASRSEQPKNEELRRSMRSSQGGSSTASTGAPSGTSR
jgi:osmotically-inducible protein OsmY